MKSSRWLFFVGFVFLQTSSAFSKPAIVQSGEHGNFSRLAITGNNLGSWQIRELPTYVEIKFPTFQGEFDLTKVFSRIDKNRLRKITVVNSALRLELACECKVSVFNAGSNLIGVDITDPITSTPTSKALQNYESPHLGASQLSFGNKVVSEPPNLRVHNTHLPFQNGAKPASAFSKFAPGLDQLDNSISFNDEKGQVTEKTNLLLENLQSELLGGFSRAATRGILELETNQRDVIKHASENSPSANNFQKTNSDRNYSIATSTNRKTTALPQHLNPETPCETGHQFHITDWSDGRPFSQQIGDASVDLYNTLGQLDIAAAVRLAQIYLFFGFGAEAQKIINIDVGIHKKRPELSAISRILENKDTDGFFLDNIDCKPSMLFWAALSDVKKNQKLIEKASEILRQLNSLPIHLRQILAPKISAYFLNAQEQKHAIAALQSLKRTEYTIPEDVYLKSAAISYEQDKPADVLKDISEIQSNSEASAAALVLETRVKLDSGQRIGDNTRKLIQAYTPEFRGTNLGLDLERALIMSFSKSGDFSEALKIAGNFTGPDKPTILRAIHNDLVELSSDQNFAQSSFSEVIFDTIIPDSNLAMKFANRLHSLGFHNQAAKFLTAGTEITSSKNRSLLEAKIAIAQDRIEPAEAILQELQGPEVKLLQAQIQSKKGNFDKAKKLFKELGHVDQTINAWLSEDWEAAFEDQDGPMKELAQLTQSQIIPTNNPDGMLGRATELLDESRLSRDMLTSIISQPLIDLSQN
jgi:hypothetical protein